MGYLRRNSRDVKHRYHIYPPDVEYNGFSYLGPALVAGEPVNLNHAILDNAKAALQIIHSDPTKSDWVIYDASTMKKVSND